MEGKALQMDRFKYNRTQQGKAESWDVGSESLGLQ